MKELAYKLEQLHIKSEMLHSLQLALYAALFNQDEIGEKNFEWAFTHFSGMTHEMEVELEELMDYAFDAWRKDGEENA